MAPKTLGAIVILIFSGVIFFLLVMPQFRASQDLRSLNTRLKGEARVAREKITSTQSVIDQFEALEQSDIARVEAALPKELDLPNLLVLVESLISSSGLIVQDIDVRSTARVAPQAATQEPPSEGREEASIDFSMIGTYESFRSFLEDAERSLRIFDAKSLNFSSPSISQGVGGFRFSVTMNTYFAK